MGEPIPQSYKRHFDYPFWPVESESELADYAEWLIDLVRHESSTEPGIRFDISILGRDRESPIPLAEFRERFDEFAFDKIFSASLDAWAPDGGLRLEFRMETRMVGAKKANVIVTGTDKHQVQQIKTKVRKEGEARIARIRKRNSEAAAEVGSVAAEILQADAKRGQARQKATPRAQTPEINHSQKSGSNQVVRKAGKRKSLSKRVLDNPYTIQIVGGLIAAVIAGLILAAFLSQ
jgi:hypothetical protein